MSRRYVCVVCKQEFFHVDSGSLPKRCFSCFFAQPHRQREQWCAMCHQNGHSSWACPQRPHA